MDKPCKVLASSEQKIALINSDKYQAFLSKERELALRIYKKKYSCLNRQVNLRQSPEHLTVVFKKTPVT